jgi:hypothetical protein
MKPDLLLKCTTAGRLPHLQLAMVPWEEGEFVFQLNCYCLLVYINFPVINLDLNIFIVRFFFVKQVFLLCCRYERAPADPYMTRRYVFA